MRSLRVRASSAATAWATSAAGSEDTLRNLAPAPEIRGCREGRTLRNRTLAPTGRVSRRARTLRNRTPAPEIRGCREGRHPRRLPVLLLWGRRTVGRRRALLRRGRGRRCRRRRLGLRRVGAVGRLEALLALRPVLPLLLE